MNDPNWYSILPPILAIVLAIWTRQVILSLFAGIWIGSTLLNGFSPIIGFTSGIDAVINVFSDPGDTRVLIFTLIIGSLITTIEATGGVKGFVNYLETRHWVHNGLRAQVLAWATGLVIFIESNITLLVAGSVSRPLFDRYKISREKLAYLIDATSAPVCAMIPLNAWGAVIIGLLATTNIKNPLQTFIASIPYNFYAIAAIILAAVVIWKNINIGPMKTAEKRTKDGDILWPNATPMIDVSEVITTGSSAEQPSATLMVLPIIMMIATMPIGLYVTGNGNIIEGSGSISVLWAVICALIVSWCMNLRSGRQSIDQLMALFMKGASSLLPIATILLFALALGDIARELGTGIYVAGLVGEAIPESLITPLVFLVSAFIAFSVGSSWGTFAIMIPIAIPIAMTLGLPAPLMLGAAISGAIFGDHASPISDTTVVASMASATDHIDHVRTQLPYALIAAAIAAIGFFTTGLFI
ncbi:MAG: C4-dicarboxylate ABC transporter [Woeseia sp.]|nr:C4-dicarboxylate ABC transporter [Woeseia sp.]|tara:strand:- start:347 stop:1759 length:1413 start_codon:yes stop_codon:yes gene_type:complete